MTNGRLSQTSAFPSPLNPLAKSFSPSPPHATNKDYGSLRNQAIDVLSFNARSLLPKITELSTLCHRLKPGIVAISETWLDPSVPDSTFLPPGYVTGCRTDRKSRRGGGVLILCHHTVSFKERRDLCCWSESAWIELAQPGQRHSLLVGCFYRPPSTLSADVEALVDSLDQTFDKIELTRSKVLVVGDFNGTNSSWCSLDQTNTPGRILHQTFLSLGLHQSVSFRTHLDSFGNLTSLLDLLLVSEKHLVEKIDSLPPLGASDHVTVYCRLRFAASKANQLECRRIWCYNKADRKAFNAALTKADWSYVQQAPDTDSAWLSWKSTFLKIAAEFVPSKVIRKLRPKLPWITEREEQEIKLKHSLFRKFKKSRLQEDRVAFQRQRNKVTQLLRRAERRYTTTLFRSSRSSTSDTRFWSCVKSMTGKTTYRSIPDLITDTGTTLQDDVDKANAFNVFFQKQTELQGNDRHPDTTGLPKNPHNFSSIQTSPSEVYDILLSLPKKKAPGWDGITTDLLRLCATGIAESLATLFNRSFSDGVFPAAWKLALVTPVFKKGCMARPNNYRPIALLSVVGKVCEKIVYKKLYHFVSPILSDNQSGFRRKDGTAHQLTRLVHEWSQALDKDQYVGNVFFDLKKAFDKVWHKGLLIKLEFAGINHHALSWFRNYLSDRYQCVKINNSTSTPVRIHAGVPQGAILSPLLFIIYMNDIASLSVQDQASFTNLFADDTSLYVANGDPTMLATELQQAVDNLSEWFDNWLLNVNIEKTALLILRKKGMPAIHITVRICGDVIHQVNKHKHLGLILKLHAHLEGPCGLRL